MELMEKSVDKELTDTEKIEHLWGRLDKREQEYQSLALLLEIAEAKNEKQALIIQSHEETIRQLSVEIARLGV